MKKLLCLSVSLILIFAACKKSNSNPSSNTPYGISAKINGTLTSFGANVTIDTTGDEVDIIGSVDSLGGYPGLNLFISENGPLKAGIYPNQAFVDPMTPSSYLNYYTTAGGGSFNTVTYASTDDTITVTSVTSKAIAGTFHGTVVNHYFDTNTDTFKDSTITVTDGTFNVNF
jgi:hypothetical protein